MKKLSEISSDTMICVNGIDTLMTKAEYLDDEYYQGENVIKLMIAEPAIQVFDWGRVIDFYEDEQYEDWGNDVHYEIKKHPDLARAADIVNEIFANHITYWEGEEVEDDVKRADHGQD